MHLNVPFGQGFGTDVPKGQKNPAGQRNPVRLSAGEESKAPPTHKIPAAHGPLGEVLPSSKNQARF